MIKYFQIAFIVCMVLTCMFTNLRAFQLENIEWQVDNTVTEQDREDIISLTKKMGIEHPQKVTFDQFLPTGCRFVRVESTVVQQGNRRNWLELNMRRRDWRECTRPEPGSSKKRMGRWVAVSSDLGKREEWRIKDGEWHVDVFLEQDVPYKDAELIILAIRRAELMNRLSESMGPIKLNTNMPQIDPSSVGSIKKNPSGVRDYELQTGRGAGLILHVRIIDGHVELLSYATWLV